MSTKAEHLWMFITKQLYWRVLDCIGVAYKVAIECKLLLTGI